jgi:hypothetical protein
MAYEKLTGKAFKEALQSDRYESATAARRAVGKASTLSDQEKDQCRKAIDAHFGDDAKPLKVLKPSREKVAPRAKVVRVEKTRATKSGRGADKSTSIFGANLPGELRQTSSGSLDDYTNLTVQMKIAEKTIQNAGSALGTLIEAKKISPDSDLTSSIEAASAVLSSAVEIFRGVTHKVTAYLANAARKDLSENHSTSSGGNGKPMFEEASP